MYLSSEVVDKAYPLARMQGEIHCRDEELKRGTRVGGKTYQIGVEWINVIWEFSDWFITESNIKYR
jgi:hypothetical protein